MFAQLVGTISGWIWCQPMIWLCIITGLVFTIALKGFQFRNNREMWRLLIHTEPSENGTSSFQAFALAVAGRVGTGNIVGVVTAIAYGGPGAVFWMWIVALLGAATSFAENTLSQTYKEKINGTYRGGTAFYIKAGLGLGGVAVLFALCGFLSNGVLNIGVQSDAIASAMNHAFGIPTWLIGLFLVVALSAIIFGGLKRISDFTAKVVPVMSVVYILVALAMVIVNYRQIPSCLGMIFSSAFGTNAVFGGIVGSAISWGVKRGVYSSEAGMGTSGQHGATADVSHPAKQGLVQALSVYVDTLFVCTATALILLMTGMYNVYDGAGNVIYNGIALDTEAGIAYAQDAVGCLLPGFGKIFMAIAMLFFAFTTLLAEYNISESCLLFLNGKFLENKVALTVFRCWFMIPVFVGCIIPTETAWACADIGTGLMFWLCMITTLMLTPTVKKIWEDYVAQRKEGKDPIFRPSKCGVKNAELWEEIADKYEAKAAQKR